MSRLRRHKVSKKKSTRKFKKRAARTKKANVHAGPMRGGIRL